MSTANNKKKQKANLVANLISNAPETETWSSKNRFHIQILEESYSEYKALMDEMHPFHHDIWKNNTIQKCTIKEVKRIENPELMAGFLLRYNELKETMPKLPVRIVRVYHSTGRQALKRIMREGFDWRLAGAKKGTMFGKGISLSGNHNFVTRFTEPEKGFCYMLACYMLLRKSHVGGNNLVIPNDDCDTTTSEKKKIYVKFDDYTVYPAYMIKYQIEKEEEDITDITLGLNRLFIENT